MVKEKLIEILNFFDPVKLSDFRNSAFINDESSIGNGMIINSVVNPIQTGTRFEVAIIGVDQYLDVDRDNDFKTPQLIREEIYRLKKFSAGLRIADLGNLKTGKNINETIFALQEVCSLLFQLKINVVVIGGSQLLTLGKFRALKEFENNINLVNIDSKIDLAVSDESVKECYFLNDVIENEQAFVYNVSSVGYQSYFVDPKQIKLLNNAHFEHYRLGTIRDNFENIEPVLRDADLVSFDISSVRMSEAPGQEDGSPNGFFADEACRLARYAGISDNVKTFGLFGVDGQYDRNGQTAKLAAQIIWYYINGYLDRKHDNPKASLKDYIKFEVQIDEIEFPIVFYKSEKSNRWWIEIQSVGNDEHNKESVIVSCTEDDYRNSCKNEIPERWWINFKKLK